MLREIDETYIFFHLRRRLPGDHRARLPPRPQAAPGLGRGAKTHIGGLQTALLGLLALLLGFTFAMSVTRFEARKNLVLEEANAIGNATGDRNCCLPPPATRSPRCCWNT